MLSVVQMLAAWLLIAGVIGGMSLMTDKVAEVFGFTLAVHTVFLVGLDVLNVTNPWLREPPAPHVELVEVEVPPVLKPPPPPVQARSEPQKDTTPKPRTRTIREPQIQKPLTPPEPQREAPVEEGGAPTVAMPDIAPAATGVAVAVGKRTTRPIGRGGTGTGTGSGSGSGSGEPTVPAPVSIATIKTRALPKGDYGYFDAGKDYPLEARQLNIEGVIRVRLVVDATGKVASAVLISRLGHGLDELALTRARKIEFEPAKDTDDKPVSSVVVWTFTMTLPK